MFMFFMLVACIAPHFCNLEVKSQKLKLFLMILLIYEISFFFVSIFPLCFIFLVLVFFYFIDLCFVFCFGILEGCIWCNV